MPISTCLLTATATEQLVKAVNSKTYCIISPFIGRITSAETIKQISIYILFWLFIINMNKEQKKAIILCYPIPYILKVKAQLKAKGKTSKLWRNKTCHDECIKIRIKCDTCSMKPGDSSQSFLTNSQNFSVINDL